MRNNLRPVVNSNVASAGIIAGGLVVASLIIAKPSLSFRLTPLTTGSVSGQFVSQMQHDLNGTPYVSSKGYTSLKEVRVDNIEYSKKDKAYHLRYTVLLNDGQNTWTSCSLTDSGHSQYVGTCDGGETKPHDRASVRIMVE